MSRFIEEIQAELETVNVRLNMIIEESKMMNKEGSRLSDRRKELMIELEELEEAENA